MNEDFELTARSLFDSLLSKSFEKSAEIEENPQAYYEPPLGGFHPSELPLFEEEDRDILMHRDAHFGRNFTIMLEHYIDEGIGAILDVSPSRIEALMELEEKLGHNLAPYLLQGPDAEKVGQSVRLYKALQEQLQNRKKAPHVAAISELILSEEEPQAASNRAALAGPSLIPYLIQLLQTSVLYDPLFPGYGQAPSRACLTLGKLHATSAIKLLFGLIGTEDFDTESASLQALKEIGEPALQFCLAQLASRPITKNNERAAILSAMFESTELAEAILTQLEDPEIRRVESLATYLALSLSKVPEALKERYKRLIALMPASVQEDMKKSL